MVMPEKDSQQIEQEIVQRHLPVLLRRCHEKRNGHTYATPISGPWNRPQGRPGRLSYASITLHYDGNIVAETTLGNTCGLLEIEWNEFIPNHDNSYVSAQPDTWYRT